MSQRCPACGHDNPPGIIICTTCAATLVNACPQCGFESPVGFKFCGNCGESLLPKTAPTTPSETEEIWNRLRSYIPEHLAEKLLSSRSKIEGERRNVTVLFADIQGFTSLAETLDPERVYDLLSDCMRGFADQIHQQEGTVDKFIGDGIMALFGAPLTHENDPERAVRSALGMLSFLETFNQSLKENFGITLHVRIGLNAGMVVAGTVGSDLRMQYTVIGDTVNLASRLEELATPDTILVSQTVWDATATIFDYLPRGPVKVKGRKAPVEIYQVIGLKTHPGAARGIRGLQAPMIGRNRELVQLHQTISDLAERHKGQIVLLTGEAGIGKSRLVSESKHFMQQYRLRVIEAVCRSHTAHVSYWLFQQLFNQAFGLREGDSDETKSQKIRLGTKSLIPTEYEDVLPFLLRLLDVTPADPKMADRIRHLSPEQLRRQTFLALRRLVLSATEVQPLVILIDDLHWVDRASLELLLFLIPLVGQCDLYMGLISRPYEGQAANLIHRLASDTCPGSYLSLPLTKLSRADSHTLVTTLLRESVLPASVQEGISEKAEGNPFFLEEVIRLLIEQGAIWRDNGIWNAKPDLDLKTLDIPQSLHALLMSRVDRLPEELKYVLQCSSVIGPHVPFPLLQAVVGKEYGPSLDTGLQELASREFLDPQPQEKHTYTFRHTLVRETVYGTLLTPRRRELHQRVGRSLEKLHAHRLDEVIDLLAYHFSEANDPARALPYTIRSAERTMNRFAYEDAVNLFERAEKFFGAVSPTFDQKLRVYQGLGDAKTFTSDFDAALKAFERALLLLREQADQEDQRRLVAEQLRKIGRTWERKADYDESLRWLGLALAELDMADDTIKTVERARVYNDMGWVNYRQGQSRKALSWAVRALEILEGTEHYQDIASAYNRLVAVYYQTGQWTKAIEFAEKGLQLREQIGYTYGVANSLGNLAALLTIEGAWDRALACVERSLHYSEQMGDIEGIAVSYNNLGLIYRDRGDFERANEALNKSLAEAERIRNPLLMVFAYNNLGHLALSRGDHQTAQGYLRQSQSLATEIGSKEQLSEALWLMAESLVESKKYEEARALALEAIDLAKQVQSTNNRGAALRTLGKLCLQSGNLSDAEEYLVAARTIYQSPQHPFELAKTRLLLAELRREQQRLPEAHKLLDQATETFQKLQANPALEKANELRRSFPPAGTPNGEDTSLLDRQQPTYVGEKTNV
ncbi:MAG: tetratricopeptide repeat protein [Chloroflexi bacterium]|nr:tetratricopeptide repeat protein [Chloroflexota bacterium]